jgi:NAD(P)-dependent dehydrogenase (short-subunit alcohol dehydrogenase family)
VENHDGLRDKVIIVTGGCGDIGAATTRTLAARGAKLVVFDLLEEDAGREKADALGAVDYLRVDQGDSGQVHGGIDEVAERFGRVDVAIGNAAVGPGGNLLDRSAEDWANSLRINLIGCAMLAQAAARQMLSQDPDPDGVRGKILFTSSWVGAYPHSGAIDYGVGKAALNHLVKVVALEFASQGIRANAVAPGILDAGLARAAMDRDDALRAPMLGSIPMDEFGNPEQIADAFLFLCSRQSNYMTGHIMFVDGGCSLIKRG